MPFGIIASLVICTVVYILVAIVMTGMAPWTELGTPEPMITSGPILTRSLPMSSYK